MSESPKPVKKVPIHLQSAQNRVYIRNGEIVNHDRSFKADVYIEDGIIKFVGPASEITIPGGVRTIDATGRLILPGGIDPHTHMQRPVGDTVAVDDFYRGTKAAVAGGTTMIIDCVLPKKHESLVEAYDKWRSWADPKVCCDYGLHVGITWWSKSVSEEVAILCKELGVNSLKMFMADKGVYMLNDSELLDVLEKIRSLNGVAMVHAENGEIIAKNTKNLLAEGIRGPEGHELSRQEEVEAEAVFRACTLAHQMKTPLYVAGVTSKSSAEILGRARRSGYCVFGETLARSIGLSMNGVRKSERIYFITSPPIRMSPETPRQLMKSLAYDDLQVTGSDNCTFNKSQKEAGSGDFTKIPNGVNGAEDRMSLMWEKGVHQGLLDPCRFVAVTSTNAAKIFNIYPQKGRIAVGSDADLVIWNPQATRTISKATHHHASDYNIFEGMTVHGVPECVLVRGRVSAENGVVRVAEGFGRFIPMAVRPPFVYDIIEGKVQPTEEPPQEEYHNGGLSKKFAELDIQIPAHEPISAMIAGNLPMPGEGSICSTPSNRGRVDGKRDLQESSFSISEELDNSGVRSSIKVKNPPGGKSSGFW
ncbi:dihydropyrimidinase-like isoform X1 [Drosophila sulfurigaster albostrigata]|uniref:dihydropyrimidinase n=1 Tax=Drosophila albomicans TaxID=7291 RepID=A0A6P8XN35_DROAB|nr:dihydropyrimidinase-like [Drosophila albomicans]XP_060645167.1 dihydropyrimidinase-like [Drosophila nasuta]XP_062122111.1 dihydropyrimidinase-like isoform X1 [Drosophila sulfurigaster albostrigata]